MKKSKEKIIGITDPRCFRLGSITLPRLPIVHLARLSKQSPQTMFYLLERHDLIARRING